MEDTLIFTSEADDLLRILTQDANFAINIAKSISHRLDDASATMEDLACANVSDRIMHALMRLASEHGVKRNGSIALDLRLTHHDIASLIGSTRETVTSELANLTRSGHLSHEGRRILIPIAAFQSV